MSETNEGVCLPRVDFEALRRPRQHALDREALDVAQRILDDIEQRGDAAVIQAARRFGDLEHDAPLWIEGRSLRARIDAVPREERAVLESAAADIHAFALAQRAAIRDVDLCVRAGVARQHVRPVPRAGAYAPGGRHPLPSSVLMTCIPARVAQVRELQLASPRPAPILCAAAALVGLERVLAIGGAQAIGAMALGTESIPAVDVIVGPGNRFVTAMKWLVSAFVRIDALAGPSELLVVAGHGVPPALIAADLLAQAEHDPDARPWLIALAEADLLAVERELERQLSDLPTAHTARQALARGAAVLAPHPDAAIQKANELAPEHLQVLGTPLEARAAEFQNYGGLFVGPASAEVFGDYGSGPNHTLPTGGTARGRGGLSVLDFLVLNTELSLDAKPALREVVTRTAAFARLEGLEAHARAAERRQ